MIGSIHQHTQCWECLAESCHQHSRGQKSQNSAEFVVGFGFHFHLKIHLKMEKYIIFRLKMRIKTSKTVTEGWPDQKETD